MAGDATSGAAASNSHSFSPLARSSTYKRPSLDPAYTRSPLAAGDESTRARVVNVHRGSPVRWSMACTILSRPPTTIVSRVASADE